MYKIPLIFLLVLTKTLLSQTKSITHKQIDSLSYAVLDCSMDGEMPEFIGGKDSLKKFIYTNYKLPIDICLQGTIYLKFVVKKDGSLSGIQITKGLQKSYDDEAIRVIRFMPKWKPGLKNKQTVRTIVNLPIKIR
jgi:hypothetical protein